MIKAMTATTSIMMPLADSSCKNSCIVALIDRIALFLLAALVTIINVYHLFSLQLTAPLRPEKTDPTPLLLCLHLRETRFLGFQYEADFPITPAKKPIETGFLDRNLGPKKQTQTLPRYYN